MNLTIFMKQSTRFKSLFMLACFSIILAIVVAYAAIHQMQKPLFTSLESSLDLAKSINDIILFEKKSQMGVLVTFKAKNPNFQNYVQYQNFSQVKQELTALQASLTADIVVVADKKGDIFASVGLDTTARLDSKLFSSTFTENKNGIFTAPNGRIMIGATAPIENTNLMLLVGVSIESNGFIDMIAEKTNADITVFKGNLRKATTIKVSGDRIIGTILDNQDISDAVLKAGETVNSMNTIQGIPYTTIYWPIENYQKDIIGIHFLGIPVKIAFEQYDDAIILTIITSIVVLLFILALATFFFSRILAPIKKIVVFADGVTKGDENASLEVYGKDDLGKLADILRYMVDTLKTKITEANKQSEEAKKAKEGADHAAQEAESAKNRAEVAKEGMFAVAVELENIVAIIVPAAEELSAQIEQSARGAQEQASRISSTATAMEEMNVAVLEVSQNATASAKLSESTRLQATQGASIANQCKESINVIRDDSLLLKNNMSTLAAHAQSITTVMSVISDIADQTNLLALNAAIEAARAGEAGRGFAVVADEVRKLAEKTINSTVDVEKAISAIQASTDVSVQQVDIAVEKIEETKKLAESSGGALQDIITIADESADSVKAIEIASKEQSITAEEITSSINQVNTIAGETMISMTEANKAVLKLSSQANSLALLIEKLKSI